MKNTLLILMFALFLPLTGNAQQLGDNKAPIEISADNSLEWLQNKNQYVANGNVEVKQGTSKILCDKLIADYRDNKTTGKTEIWQLTAYDNVRLINDDNQAYGDQATYNVDTGLSIITGNNLKLTMPEQTITAHERMEYNMDEGRAKAIGNAQIVRGADSLNAQNINAVFGKNAQGKQVLQNATATGNVKITGKRVKGVFFPSSKPKKEGQ